MNAETFIKDIHTYKWFVNVGGFESTRDIISLQHARNNLIWDWLPMTKFDIDPFHEEIFHQEAKLNPGYLDMTSKIYKSTLVSLRNIGVIEKFISENQDDTNAAKNSALYASRACMCEILLGINGPWTLIMSLYKSGFWPCAIESKTKRIIVF